MFGDSNVFEPFNVTRWERASLIKVVRQHSYRHPPIPPTATGHQRPIKLDGSQPELICDMSSPQEDVPKTRQWFPLPRLIVREAPGAIRAISGYLKAPWSRPDKRRDNAHPPQPQSSLSTSEANSYPAQEATTTAVLQTPLPWLRSQYDMRAYGFPVIFDFGISRSKRS